MVSVRRHGDSMLFMGQKFLEDKQWSDDFVHRDLLLYWRASIRATGRCSITCGSRGNCWPYAVSLPALVRGRGFRCDHMHDQNRLLAFHRWVEGKVRDVMVILHLLTSLVLDIKSALPGREPGVKCSTAMCENWVNAGVAGSNGRVWPTRSRFMVLELRRPRPSPQTAS